MSTIKINSGSLTLSSVKLSDAKRIGKVFADGREVSFVHHGDVVKFDTLKAEKELVFKV